MLNLLETISNKDERIHVSFRVSDTMKKDIQEFTKAHGISTSALTRFAITFYLNIHSNKSIFSKLYMLFKVISTMKKIRKEVSKSPK